MLQALGIHHFLGAIHHNLSYAEICAHEAQEQGTFLRNGAFSCSTGQFTGRSPYDKYVVRQSPSQDHVWWEGNQECSPDTFQSMWDVATSHYDTHARTVYIFDGTCGASARHAKKVRIISEFAWQHHFAKNMFRPVDPTPAWTPDFTILNACRATHPHPERHALHSNCFVAFNIEAKRGVIGGTWYTGEMKKGMFSMMHYWLPPQRVLTMHCAANIGEHNDVALFFGLSGTGKTTLSTQPGRRLIGDDEHGWDEEGVFNLEGGCYAKTGRLCPAQEPEIWNAIRKDALVENAVVHQGVAHFGDTSLTKNGRVSYPLAHIPHHQSSGTGPHPRNIIFLTCDSFGVLPPIAKLSTPQAMYHFLSGYTTKLPGIERSIQEPEATFSACFGEAFLTLHPSVYAELLAQKMEDHQVEGVYLINTGWTGGGLHSGRRLHICETRACVNAVLQGHLRDVPMTTDPHFGFRIPRSIPGLDAHLLHPRDTWADPQAYDSAAHRLCQLFHTNFDKYQLPHLRPGGPHV